MENKLYISYKINLAKTKYLFFTPHLKEDTFTYDIYEQWQADLVDIQQHKKETNRFSYILTVIDCYSKYAWCIPLKDKMGKEIINVFTDLFKNRKPKKLQ